MSNIHNIKENASSSMDEQRLDEACTWVTRLDRGLSNIEKSELKQWLAKDSQNLTCFMETAKLWDKMDELSRLSDLFPQTQVPLKRSPVWVTSIAASILIAVLFSFFQGYLFIDDKAGAEHAVLLTQTSYSTTVGQSNTINLPDSSKLVLNTNSFVQVKYTPEARVIELLRGEIHIDVAHDKLRPLSVVAGNKVIQAVGTAFNVEVRNENVELIVTDGRVRVAKHIETDTKTDELEPILALPISAMSIAKGEKVELDLAGDASEEVLKVDKAEIDASLSWRTGRLIFRGESLADALEEISRYTDVKFEVEQSNYLEKVKVAGMFKTGDVAGLLGVLNQNFNIEHEKLENGAIKLKHAG